MGCQSGPATRDSTGVALTVRHHRRSFRRCTLNFFICRRRRRQRSARPDAVQRSFVQSAVEFGAIWGFGVFLIEAISIWGFGTELNVQAAAWGFGLACLAQAWHLEPAGLITNRRTG